MERAQETGKKARRQAEDAALDQGSNTVVMSTSCSRRTKKPLSLSSLEVRDWAKLPQDALLEVFLRVDTHDILWSAEFVCKAWRHVAIEEPTLWRHVDMTRAPMEHYDTAVRDIVDRSAGMLEAFSGPWDDTSLLFIGARAQSLKSLHLSYNFEATDEILMAALKKLPLLEDLDISPPFYDLSASDKLFESVCKACPLLKNLKIRFTVDPDFDFEAEAMLMECVDGDIYRTPVMCQLQSIELFKYVFSNEQLTAILDNCLLLESLHITGCHVDGVMDEELRAKCARVKNLNIPFEFDPSEGDSGHSDFSEDDQPLLFDDGND